MFNKPYFCAFRSHRLTGIKNQQNQLLKNLKLNLMKRLNIYLSLLYIQAQQHHKITPMPKSFNSDKKHTKMKNIYIPRLCKTYNTAAEHLRTRSFTDQNNLEKNTPTAPIWTVKMCTNIHPKNSSNENYWRYEWNHKVINMIMQSDCFQLAHIHTYRQTVRLQS